MTDTTTHLLTTKALGERLGISPQHITGWRSGPYGFPEPAGTTPSSRGFGRPQFLWDWDTILDWLRTTGRWNEGSQTLRRLKGEKPTSEDARSWAKRMGFSLYEEEA